MKVMGIGLVEKYSAGILVNEGFISYFIIQIDVDCMYSSISRIED